MGWTTPGRVTRRLEVSLAVLMASGHDGLMCRSIKTLRPPYTDDAGESEYHAAALQYVRKVSGFRAPSAKNQAVFDEAVERIAAATAELMADLQLPKTHSHAVTP